MIGARRARSAIAVGLVLASAAAAGGGGETQPSDPYVERLLVYRSGDFPAAVRASAEAPMRHLRDQARDFLRRSSQRDERNLLAAAMLHFDLAWALGMEPEANERLGREILGHVQGERRDEWILDSHLGLLGIYAEAGVLEAAVRMATFLHEEYPRDPAVRLARARLAEFIGWGIHDERFFDQAQSGYEELLVEGYGDPAELRLRIAHLSLRAGAPEAALGHVDRATGLSPRQRFVSELLRGEILLWLDRVEEAEAAFTAAQAIHLGSASAAAGLVAARQARGDGAGAAEAVRGFLSQTTGQDAWWGFLVEGLARETGRLDRLRGLASQPDR